VNLLCDTGNQTGVSVSEVPFLGFYFISISQCMGSNKILFLGPLLLLHGCAAGWNYDWNPLTTLRNRDFIMLGASWLNIIATSFLLLLRNWMFRFLVCTCPQLQVAILLP
jgi:hypothetical protein